MLNNLRAGFTHRPDPVRLALVMPLRMSIAELSGEWREDAGRRLDDYAREGFLDWIDQRRTICAVFVRIDGLDSLTPAPGAPGHHAAVTAIETHGGLDVVRISQRRLRYTASEQVFVAQRAQ